MAAAEASVPCRIPITSRRTTNLNICPLPHTISDRLPGELYDRFIYHLRHRKRSLKICALVCRAWLPASRYHLFRYIHLTPRRVPGFLEFVDAPGSSFRSYYIYSLSLEYRFQDLFVRKGAWFEDGIPLLRNHHINDLSFKGMQVFGIPYSFWQKAPTLVGTYYHTVTCLRFQECMLYELRVLTSLLSCLPNLTQLYVEKTRMRSTESPDTSHRPPASLHTLLLDFYSPESCIAFLSWLAHSEPVPSLRNIALHQFPPTCWSSIASFFHALGQHPETVTLYPCSDNGLLSNMFAHNTNLRTLRIIARGPLPSIGPSLLGRLVLPAVNELILDIGALPVEETESQYWKELNMVLEQPQFSKLRIIRFNVTRDRKAMSRFIRDRLPAFAAERKIQVKQSVPGRSWPSLQ